MLREPGFLRKYEGTWTITGPSGKGPGGAYKTPAAVAAESAHSASGLSLPFLQHRNVSSPTLTPSPSASGLHDASAAASPRSLSSTSYRGSCSGSSSGSSSGGLSPADTPRSSASGGVGLGGFLASINNPFMSSGHQGSSAATAEAIRTPLQTVSPTTIVVSKCISPKVAPPFPINQVRRPASWYGIVKVDRVLRA